MVHSLANVAPPGSWGPLGRRGGVVGDAAGDGGPGG